jgi:fructose-bisphosphate aldolase class II
MTLAKMMDVLQPAMEDGYAVGAFNADNLEMVQAFVQAAVAERSPLILQVSQGAIQYSGMGHVTQLCRFVAQEVDIPIVVHLDHGKDYVQNIRALKAGVTCLGVDASMLPYDENIAVTRKVAQMAHHAGLHAEVEMAKTDPDQAYEFVQQTGVDLLAVALGSMRGMRQREIALDIERLKAIRERVSIPFVLHGSSGVHWESIQDAIREGVCKVNLAACFDRRLVEVMRELLDKNPEEFNFRKIIGPAREQVRELAREQYRLLGSNGRV